MNEDNPYICYVLMRTDLPDYLPGKCMAQAHHAGTRFLNQLRVTIKDKPVWLVPLEGWLAQGGGFGTTIILGVNYPEMRRLTAFELDINLFNGVVHDPSYPVRDGDRINHMPVDTCGYVFGRLNDCKALLGHLPLFRD